MTMDIHTPMGGKVIFRRANAGYPKDQETAEKHLRLGAVYTVGRTKPGKFHTDVYLEEVPGVAFNSVHFENV